MLEQLMESGVPIIVYILELMGVFIIFVTAVKAFAQYALKLFDVSDNIAKIELANALALGLEFMLGGEILKSLLVRTVDELIILASIMGLRIILTFVIHWETKSDSEDCHSLLQLKQEYEKLNKKKNPVKKNTPNEDNNETESSL